MSGWLVREHVRVCVCMCACCVSATLSGGSQCCGCRASWGRQPASGCHTQCVCEVLVCVCMFVCLCLCLCLCLGLGCLCLRSVSVMCGRCVVCDVRVWCCVMLFAMAVFARGLCACVPLRHDLADSFFATMLHTTCSPPSHDGPVPAHPFGNLGNISVAMSASQHQRCPQLAQPPAWVQQPLPHLRMPPVLLPTSVPAQLHCRTGLLSRHMQGCPAGRRAGAETCHTRA